MMHTADDALLICPTKAMKYSPAFYML